MFVLVKAVYVCMDNRMELIFWGEGIERCLMMVERGWSLGSQEKRGREGAQFRVMKSTPRVSPGFALPPTLQLQWLIATVFNQLIRVLEVKDQKRATVCACGLTCASPVHSDCFFCDAGVCQVVQSCSLFGGMVFICVLLASGGYVLTGQVLKNDMDLDTASDQTPSCKTQTGLISPGYKKF